jgi:hypothetical protein
MPEMAFVSRDDTLLVAQLAGWPEVQLGPLTVGTGEAGWRAIIGRSAPADRTQLGQSLPPVPPVALLAGEGRRRLLAYYARHAGRPPTANDAAVLDRTLNYIGDLSIKKVLVSVLTPLPAAVVDLVVSAVWIFGTGRETGGWFSVAPPLPILAPDAEALRIIALSGHRDDGDIARLVAHEIAHAWIEGGGVPECATEAASGGAQAMLPGMPIGGRAVARKGAKSGTMRESVTANFARRHRERWNKEINRRPTSQTSSRPT